MRPGQQNKRGRGRSGTSGGSGNNNGNRKGANPLSRSYDSSGPDVKIRGTAQHVAEKYMNLARDAQSSGDRVMAENYLQHAEHYNRIIAAAQAQMQERFQRDDRDSSGRDGVESDDDNERSDEAETDAPVQQASVQQAPVRQARKPKPSFEENAPQPVIEGTPAEVAMEEEVPSASAARPAGRRRGRPRRVRVDETDGSAATDQAKGESGPVEVAGAE